MKTLFIAALISVQMFECCRAGTSILPEIPSPKLTPMQALSIAGHLMHNATNYVVVGLDWCKSSTFQPRLGDGTYNPGGDDPDEYSWFVTFIYKDAATDRQLRTMNISRHFNSVLIERIKDNGKQGVLIGVQ